jgi:hypothetical protein
MDRNQLVDDINCMSRLLTAVKDCFIQDRTVKDEIISLGSAILLENLREMKKTRQETGSEPL